MESNFGDYWVFSSKILYMLYINCTIMRNENVNTIDKNPMQGFILFKERGNVENKCD